MQLAMEGSPSYLQEISSLTDFEWVLTNVAMDNPEYLAFYTHLKQVKPFRTIVVDSGVNEEGTPRSLKDMDTIIKLVKAEYIIPPDILNNSEKSWDLLMSSLDLWKREKLVPVIQGSTILEVLDYTQSVVNLGFTKICIPYDLMRKRTEPLRMLADSRVNVVTRLLEKFPVLRSLHLLGLNTLEEVQYYSGYFPKVVSLDTGAPFLNAIHRRRFLRQCLLPKGVYIDYTEETKDIGSPTRKDVLADCSWNIAVLRKFISPGSGLDSRFGETF